MKIQIEITDQITDEFIIDAWSTIGNYEKTKLHNETKLEFLKRFLSEIVKDKTKKHFIDMATKSVMEDLKDLKIE